MKTKRRFITDEELISLLCDMDIRIEEHPEILKIVKYLRTFHWVEDFQRRRRNRRARAIAGLVAWALFLFHVYMLT